MDSRLLARTGSLKGGRLHPAVCFHSPRDPPDYLTAAKVPTTLILDAAVAYVACSHLHLCHWGDGQELLCVWCAFDGAGTRVR
jgi:hypothetical protein